MSLQDKIMQDTKDAMKARDSVKLVTLRMVRAQMKDFQISKGEELTPDDEIAVLTNAAKKRREAIEMYEKSDRDDLLAKEKQELEIISAYLPEQLSEEEIGKIVSEVVSQVGASSAQDLGKVMGAVMGRLKGKADGKLVQEIVRKKLS